MTGFLNSLGGITRNTPLAQGSETRFAHSELTFVDNFQKEAFKEPAVGTWDAYAVKITQPLGTGMGDDGFMVVKQKGRIAPSIKRLAEFANQKSSTYTEKTIALTCNQYGSHIIYSEQAQLVSGIDYRAVVAAEFTWKSQLEDLILSQLVLVNGGSKIYRGASATKASDVTAPATADGYLQTYNQIRASMQANYVLSPATNLMIWIDPQLRDVILRDQDFRNTMTYAITNQPFATNSLPTMFGLEFILNPIAIKIPKGTLNVFGDTTAGGTKIDLVLSICMSPEQPYALVSLEGESMRMFSQDINTHSIADIYGQVGFIGYKKTFGGTVLSSLQVVIVVEALPTGTTLILPDATLFPTDHFYGAHDDWAIAGTAKAGDKNLTLTLTTTLDQNYFSFLTDGLQDVIIDVKNAGGKVIGTGVLNYLGAPIALTQSAPITTKVFAFDASGGKVVTFAGIALSEGLATGATVSARYANTLVDDAHIVWTLDAGTITIS